MTKLKNANILITGGVSGIGKIMGRMALEKGAKSLIIWDINQDNLESTKAEFATLGTVFTYAVNVADSDAVIAAYQRVKKECGDVDILIN